MNLFFIVMISSVYKIGTRQTLFFSGHHQAAKELSGLDPHLEVKVFRTERLP